MASVKEELIEIIKECEDKDLLAEILTFLQSRQPIQAKDWWDELSIAQKNKIEEALAQYRSGNYISHLEMQKKMEQWRKR